MDFEFYFILAACFLIYLCVIFLFRKIEDADFKSLGLRIALYFGCVLFLFGLIVHCIFNIYHEEQIRNKGNCCAYIEYQIERSV